MLDTGLKIERNVKNILQNVFSSHKHKKNMNKLYEVIQEKVIKLTTKMIANIRIRFKTQICAIK